MGYEVYFEYPIDKVCCKVKTYDTLSDAVKHNNEENKKLKDRWSGDFKYYFVRDLMSWKESLDGEQWQDIKK